MTIRFDKDGTVLAKKGDCWAILYRPEETKKHLEAMSEKQDR